MKITDKVKKILANYESENAGVKTNLSRLLMQGRLAGTGHLVILPVDQGFEHGPDRSFAKNPAAYDPNYHFELAIEAGLNAYAAPLGFLSAGASKYAGQIPTILKMNSSNSLLGKGAIPDQAITGSVKDALELGCSAVGLTIYPGSGNSLNMLEEAREIIREAKSYGLAAVVWSYPRGGDLSKEGETALDVCAYAAHMAALVGAHIIKVKPPTLNIEQLEAKKAFEEANMKITNLTEAFAHIVQSCFNGKRIVVFSGGATKSMDDVLAEAHAIKHGKGNGSIIGRNCFQRPRNEALDLLDKICNIYLN